MSPQHPRLLTDFGHKISAETKISILILGLRQKLCTKFCSNENFAGGSAWGFGVEMLRSLGRVASHLRCMQTRLISKSVTLRSPDQLLWQEYRQISAPRFQTDPPESNRKVGFAGIPGLKTGLRAVNVLVKTKTKPPESESFRQLWS